MLYTCLGFMLVYFLLAFDIAMFAFCFIVPTFFQLDDAFLLLFFDTKTWFH